MKKRISKIIAVMIISIALLYLLAAVALALGDTDYTATLTVGRRTNYVGDEVEFTLHLVNTGQDDIYAFYISSPRGGVIENYGELKVGESADIAMTKVFNAAGEFGVQYEVLGTSENEYVDVTTNTVTVTINNPPTSTPAPTQEPTQEQMQEPTQELTPEPTPTPEETVIAVLDESAMQLQSPNVEVIAQKSDDGTEQKRDIVLYILIAVVGAISLTSVVLLLVLIRKLKVNEHIK